MKTVICDYCGSKTQLVTGEKIYPHRPDLYSLSFYYCDNGHDPAYVGCHKGTDKPLGRVADAELRQAKSEAHAAFDPLWKRSDGLGTRSSAYVWLAEQLGLPKHETHIGMFDVDTCRKVCKICNEYAEKWLNNERIF